jgi:hypothetical protein
MVGVVYPFSASVLQTCKDFVFPKSVACAADDIKAQYRTLRLIVAALFVATHHDAQ